MPSAETQPLVSVLMPSYNAADRLRSAVMSVLEQTLTQLEIIIVDDASSDATPSVVKDLQMHDSRIVFLRKSRNSGPSAARNIALSAARGIWVTPVDADDSINRDRLLTLYEAGEALSADMIADDVMFVGPFGSEAPPPSSGSETPDGVSVEVLIESDIPLNGLCSLGYLKPLIRREFLCRFHLQYDEELRFAEDFNLYARALLCGARFFLHPGSSYFYQQTPRSITRSEGTLPELARYAMLGNEKLQKLTELMHRTDLKELLDSHRLRWATILWFNRMRQALNNGESRKALQLLVNCPGGTSNMLAFAKDRLNANRGNHAALSQIVQRRVTIGRNIEYS